MKDWHEIILKGWKGPFYTYNMDLLSGHVSVNRLRDAASKISQFFLAVSEPEMDDGSRWYQGILFFLKTSVVVILFSYPPGCCEKNQKYTLAIYTRGIVKEERLKALVRQYWKEINNSTVE